MRIKLILQLKLLVVLLLLSISACAGVEQRPEENNVLRCESISSQVTYNVYEGLFIKHQLSGEKIKIGDSGDVPLVCTNDGKWLIYFVKGSSRFDKEMGHREIVDLWRLELNSKRREKIAVADFDDLFMLGNNILSPIGAKLFLGSKIKEAIQTEEPKWEIVGSKTDWRDSSAVWLKDGSAIISSTWNADLNKDVLMVEQFTPKLKRSLIDLNIDNFLISSIDKQNKLTLKVWADDSVKATGTVECTLDIKGKKSACGKIKENTDSYEMIFFPKKEANLKKFAPYVKEYKDTLYLKMKSGGYLKFTNYYDCVGYNSCRIFKFLDYYKDKGFYVLSIFIGEPTLQFFASDTTGKQLYIEEESIISPERDHIIAISSYAQFQRNGVFVWRLENEDIISELSFKTGGGTGGYTFIDWKDEKTILLNRVFDADKKYCPQVPTMTMPVTLKKENNEWEFINNPSGIICKDLHPGSPAYNELEKEKSFGKYFNNENHVLSLRLKSGVYKELSGLKDCDKQNYCGPFYFIDYFKDIGFYYVCNGDYWCEENFLISDITGMEYSAENNLLFIPDRSILLSYGHTPSHDKFILILWKIKDNKLIEIPINNSNADFTSGSYRFLNSIGDSTFLLSISARADTKICPDSLYMEFPATLKINKDGWKITEDRSPKHVKCIHR